MPSHNVKSKHVLLDVASVSKLQLETRARPRPFLQVWREQMAIRKLIVLYTFVKVTIDILH